MRTAVRKLKQGIAAASVVVVGIAVPLCGPRVASASDPTVQSAWTSFQQTVASAISQAKSNVFAAGAQGQADAANFVTSMAQMDLNNQLLDLDPNNPVLLRDPDPFTIPGQDPTEHPGVANPDNLYYNAVVVPGATYQITGKWGNSTDFNIQPITGYPGDGSTGSPSTTLELSAANTNPDGTFTINIGPNPMPGNWLQTTASTNYIDLRETFNDWATAVPDTLSIARTDQSGPAVTSLSSSQLAGALNGASSQVTEETSFWLSEFGTLVSALPANSLTKPTVTPGGLSDQLSSFGHFSLSAGQAFVVTVPPAAVAGYQSLEVANLFSDTLPYGDQEASLNATQAYLGSDGNFHFVVSPTNPGVPNWIDTQGRTQGFLFLRYQLLSSSLPSSDDATGQVVSLSQLSSVLPAGTPSVSASQYASEMATRDQAFANLIASSSDDAEPKLSNYLSQLVASIGSSDAFHSVYPGWVLPSSNMLLPSNGSSIGGTQYLDADAPGTPSSTTTVQFQLTGGSFNNTVVASATPTLYGWLAPWDTRSVPNGTYTLQSVSSYGGGVTASSTPITVTVDNVPPTIVLPLSGATLSQNQYLDAVPSPGVTQVQFELTGGTYSNTAIATATPSLIGWLAAWNTTAVPNGAYTLQAVSTYGDGATVGSSPIAVTVNNAPPTTSVVLPASGATMSQNQYLDAVASSGVTQVQYELSGGPTNLSDDVIATGTPTLYGWLAAWNTTGVANGTYTLQSMASYGGGVSGTSPPITVTVSN
jgi:hypothetical protein